jgi:hypothetical protein
MSDSRICGESVPRRAEPALSEVEGSARPTRFVVPSLGLPHKLKYRILQERLAVCRAAADARIPAWGLEGEFFCVTRTGDELSIVCPENRIAEDREGVVVESGWIALKLEGPFAFAMTGVLASFIQPLVAAGISIFAISTFDTDYVLIKEENRKQALTALGAAGHREC